MSSDIHNNISVQVENLNKCYHIYDKPHDRLKQMLLPRLQRYVNQTPKTYYHEFWALKNVSLSVDKGETVGIIGRNGSGKSTLLQMICGTLNPTSGNIQTGGRIAALLELGSGFNPEFTGRENVYMNGAVLGLNKEEIDVRFDKIIGFADIGNFIEQPIKSFSSGMRVRLAFAVAINVDPEILVIDEALSVGDELFQRKCFSRIEAIRASGATILFVSHSGSHIIDLCDRAILLDAGEKIEEGLPKDVVTHYQKLLYAPKDKQANLRAEFMHKENIVISSDRHGQIDDAREMHVSGDQREHEETFDPNLAPVSTIEYESHGPVIGMPTILTLDGRKVNGLVRGRKYRYCYRVKFNRTASQVRFGMSIKTTTGFSIGGALSAPSLSEAVSVVEQGKGVDVEFSFYCHLNPGVYFTNAGVFGLKGADQIVLHRRSDILAFRVLPIIKNLETEVVSFGFSPVVKLNA